jgi:small subunit ribosomal protein S7
VPQKRVNFIPPDSNELMEKFINNVMQKGKKNTARRIFKDAFLEVQKRTNQNPEEVFNKALANATPVIEVRPKRVGGAVYQVPMEVRPKRQLSLSVRWILNGARSRKGQPMAKRLASELIDAFNNTGAAVKKKEDVFKMAQANKAFAHFAKY